MTSLNAASFKIAAATLTAARADLTAKLRAGEITRKESIVAIQAVRARLIAEHKAQAVVQIARKALVRAVVRAWSATAEWRDEGDAIEALIAGGHMELANISCEEALEALAAN